MKKIKVGLFWRILIAIAVGVALGFAAMHTGAVGEVGVRVLKTFNVLFAQVLKFIVPLLILGLVTPAIANAGKGAGKLPTASAVCADIIDAAKNPSAGNVPLRWTPTEEILAADEIKSTLCIITEAGSDAEKLATALGKHFYRTASTMAAITSGKLSSADIKSVIEAKGFIKTYSVM